MHSEVQILASYPHCVVAPGKTSDDRTDDTSYHPSIRIFKDCHSCSLDTGVLPFPMLLAAYLFLAISLDASCDVESEDIEQKEDQNTSGLYMLNMMPYGVGYPLGQLGSAVPAVSPPSFLCTPSLLAVLSPIPLGRMLEVARTTAEVAPSRHLPQVSRDEKRASQHTCSENDQAAPMSSRDLECDEQQPYTHKHHHVLKSSASCSHAHLLTRTYAALHHIYQSQRVLVYSHSWEGSPPQDFIQDAFNLVTALPTAVYLTHVEGENQRQNPSHQSTGLEVVWVTESEYLLELCRLEE
ncbi:hypothetical protein QYF61_003846 [Mycteria americana]|uniref:Uncharacterized protein n=1 Tax=Mycteria americana TaxID=33587 RepID=A0AAN7S2I5_MYCAM|nr:hypothetical protein QYF61_003846 [Mycteria americana]